MYKEKTNYTDIEEEDFSIDFDAIVTGLEGLLDVDYAIKNESVPVYSFEKEGSTEPVKPIGLQVNPIEKLSIDDLNLAEIKNTHDSAIALKSNVGAGEISKKLKENGIVNMNYAHDVLWIQKKLFEFESLSEADYISEQVSESNTLIAQTQLAKTIAAIIDFQHNVLASTADGQVTKGGISEEKLRSLSVEEVTQKRTTLAAQRKEEALQEQKEKEANEKAKAREDRFIHQKTDEESLRNFLKMYENESIKELACGLVEYAPFNDKFVIEVINTYINNQFIDFKSDDLAYEICKQSNDQKLASYSSNLRQTLYDLMSSGIVTEEEEVQRKRLGVKERKSMWDQFFDLSTAEKNVEEKTTENREHPFNGTFDEINAMVLKHEGGFVNHKNDKGGATNKGITFNTFQTVAKDTLGIAPTLENLKSLTKKQATIIYRKHFWDKMRMDEINHPSIRYAIYDFFVNAGYNSVFTLQEVINTTFKKGLKVDGILGSGTIKAINEISPMELFIALQKGRKAYYESEIKEDPSQKVFIEGWFNRVDALQFVEEKRSEKDELILLEKLAQKRAVAGKEIIKAYKKNGTKYSNEKRQMGKDAKFADCSSLITSVLELAGQTDLFKTKYTGGGEGGGIQGEIKKIEKAKNLKDPYRKNGPKIGDIMMWGKHIAIVTEVNDKNLKFANMGVSGGAKEIIIVRDKGDKTFLLQIGWYSNTPFWGFWTPK